MHWPTFSPSLIFLNFHKASIDSLISTKFPFFFLCGAQISQLKSMMGKGESAVIESMEVEAEEIPDSFLCCVCLDLLYKPVVLSCGHIACFWCVHKSMSSLCESHCPICRNPYNHFPTICWMLHSLLLKMYPISYSRREKQILEEEKEMGYFSPEFGFNACGSHAVQEYAPTDLVHSSTASLQSSSWLDFWTTRKGEVSASMDQTQPASMIKNDVMYIPNQIPDKNLEAVQNVGVEEKTLPQNKPNGNCKHVSVADVQCCACQQLLFHPVVLNCGHVYCKTCIMDSVDKMLRCHACQTLHPSGFPKVCLEFDHFIEAEFPKEYSLRRDAIQLKQGNVKIESLTFCSTEGGKEGALSSSVREHLPWQADPHSLVHIGVGCDYCGVLPIIGDRYKCKDCVEKIGFDLCGDCYNTRSKLPGRFNQQHTPEHRFELVNSNNFGNIMLRLVNGHWEDPSENESPAPTFSNDAQESTENSLAATFSNSESTEDQDETQSTS